MRSNQKAPPSRLKKQQIQDLTSQSVLNTLKSIRTNAEVTQSVETHQTPDSIFSWKFARDDGGRA
jgi:hypothetical protein